MVEAHGMKLPKRTQAEILSEPEGVTEALLLPKTRFENREHEAFATAAVFRSAPGTTVRQTRIREEASQRLAKLGLREAMTADGRTDKGSFVQLGSIGGTAAYFADAVTMRNVQNELSADFDVIPNFSLAMPSRLGADKPGDQATHGWPTQSNIATAHADGHFGQGVLVGVLDTGIDADHAEFIDRVIPFRHVAFTPDDPATPSRDMRGYDVDGHGSEVCSIVAGRTIGVAPHAELVVAAVIESDTVRTSLIRVVSGLDWLLGRFSDDANQSKPAIVNLSLGFPSDGIAVIDAAEYDARLAVIRRLLRVLVQANVLPVVAVGNDGPGQYMYPAGFPEALGVGAVDHANAVAGFSGSRTSGSPRKPDLYGYGVDSYCSAGRDSAGTSHYMVDSGTSMAAPYVTGIAALLLCRQPRLRASQLRNMLIAQALRVRAGRTITKIARFQ